MELSDQEKDDLIKALVIAMHVLDGGNLADLALSNRLEILETRINNL